MIKCVCVVCGRTYERDLEKGKLGAIYCSGTCAWASAPRDRASMVRERDALRKILGEKPD